MVQKQYKEAEILYYTQWASLRLGSLFLSDALDSYFLLDVSIVLY